MFASMPHESSDCGGVRSMIASHLRADGSVVMTLDVTDDYALRNWILGFGRFVKVLAPAQLVKWMESELEAAWQPAPTTTSSDATRFHDRHDRSGRGPCTGAPNPSTPYMPICQSVDRLHRRSRRSDETVRVVATEQRLRGTCTDLQRSQGV